MSQPWTPPPPQTDAGATVPNYLIPAIVSTVLCCLPLGAVSIYFATQVNKSLAAGDTEGAKAASKKAKTFMIIAIVAAAVIWIACILIWALVFGMAALSR